MDNDAFDALCRAGEVYHDTRVPPDCPLVVRVDGRGFTRLTEQADYSKPFDEGFHRVMLSAAETLLRDLGGLYAYTQSDEISVLLPADWAMFDREHEKIISVAAGIASAAWTHHSGLVGHFDARVWLPQQADLTVIDYFLWRRSNSLRCATGGLAYWALRRAGKTARQATRHLDGRNLAQKMLLLTEHAVDTAALPPWQLWGSALYWESYAKDGHNPLTGQTVRTRRRRIKIDEEAPLLCNEDYSAFLLGLLED